MKGENITINFLLDLLKKLQTYVKKNIIVALLKANSPSCGNLNIYDGSFSQKLIEGEGLTARLLKDSIKIFNETQLNELNKFIKPINSFYKL